jgi:superfamily II DNA/RNA helicase
VIQEAIKGHDILARARTGSGKTAAFVIPVLNAILTDKVMQWEFGDFIIFFVVEFLKK